jgi:hypothetical protein
MKPSEMRRLLACVAVLCAFAAGCTRRRGAQDSSVERVPADVLADTSDSHYCSPDGDSYAGSGDDGGLAGIVCGQCPANPARVSSIDISISFSQVAGPLPECPETAPFGVQVIVLNVATRLIANDPARPVTDIDVSRADLGVLCMFRISVQGPAALIGIQVGESIVVYQKTTVRDPEADVTGNYVLRDSNGAILLARTIGARTDMFDRDVYFDVTLQASPLCQFGDSGSILACKFEFGHDQCALDGYSERDCFIFGMNYHVSIDSSFQKANAVFSKTNFSVWRSDMFARP